MENDIRKKILIIRLSAIGDVVMASPLIGAFRRTMPEARLCWLVEEASRAVLEANPELDEIIVWPRNRWRDLTRGRHYWILVKEAFAFARDLRKRKFDLAVDAQGLLKSGLWAYLSGASERIGIGSKEGSRYLMTRVVDRSGASNRISSQYLLLAEALDLDTGDFRMDVPLSEDARAYGDRFASSMGGKPYAVICPFTTRPQKHWIEERWQELMEYLINEMKLHIVLLGGPGDVSSSNKLLTRESRGCMNLTGETSIQQAAAVMDKAALAIGVDTGLTHLAIALGVPTIALFGATRPYLDTRNTSGTVIYHPHECSPCRRNPTCDEDYTCMKAITTKEVSLAAAVLMGPA